MRNLTTLAVEALGGGAPWQAVAPDAEAADGVYVASAERGAEGLVRLTVGRATPTECEELASLAVVGAPGNHADEIRLFQMLADGGEVAGNAPALCLVTAGGDIVYLLLDTLKAEIVGSVEQGLLAARWSLDEEVLVLITAPGADGVAKLLIMTRDLEVLHEAPLSTDDFGEDQPVNVGWGSKATQFHGSEGKQAAAAQPRAGDARGPPVPEDDGLPRVAWRSDGAFFVVSSLERDAYGAHRILRVYTRAGVLSATSDATVRGISHCLAVRPIGNVIATTQRAGRTPDGDEWAPGRDGRHDVVFFERNGLRHGEFSLREEHGAGPKGNTYGEALPAWNTPHAVQSLAWNADGSALAVHLVRGPHAVVQVWTTKNYHWYLKQEIQLEGLRALLWHAEEPLWLYLVHAGGIEKRVYAADTAVSSGTPPHDASCAAVVDGHALLLTPFRLQNVPPPMCAVCILDTPRLEPFVPQVPVHIAWDTVGGDATTDYLAVLFREEVHVWRIAYGVLGSRAKWAPERVAVLRVAPGAIQVALAVSDSITIGLLRPDGAEWVQGGDQGTLAFSTCGARRLVTMRETKALVVHGPDGSVVDVATSSPLPSLPTFCERLVVFPAPHATPLGLARDGRLVLPDRTLAKDATSFAVTNRLVVWTTWTHEARFLPLAALSGDVQTLELGRRVERGSTIVTAVPSAMSLVLQMPRGNLETICPRPMVLDVIRDLIDRGEYGEALRTARAHRVDLNILHDHNPTAFLASIPQVLEQVDNVDHINLLLSSMRYVGLLTQQ